MPFKPGESGNPGGRKSLPPEVKQTLRRNGEKAANIIAGYLDDDSAWGREGWLDQKVQVTLLNQAQDRAFGKAENLSISHSHRHEGTIEHKDTPPARPSLKAVKLPEKGAVIEGKAVEVK